jgi:hypothetical protein
VSEPGPETAGLRAYEVGVAVAALSDTLIVSPRDQEERTPGGVPGYDEALGRGKANAARMPALIEKGEGAVQTATEAIAGQIGLTAQRIARAIGDEVAPPSGPGELGLESVQVSFGVTLAAGLQAIFTAQAESSVQVTLTLSRRPGPNSANS